MAPACVLDASVAMSWCFKDEGSSYALSVLESLSRGEAVTPAIWPLEVGNVLLVAERKGRVNKAESQHFLSLLSGLPVSVDQESPERMFGEILPLARKLSLSTYDASYLDLAIRRGVPLATQDSRLRKAAGKCQVAIYNPSKLKNK